MQHLVRKQIIELTLGSSEDSFAIQHEISRQFRGNIIKQIEMAFDEISSENEMLIIDKLEIDCGSISESDFKRGSWSEEIGKKISEQLRSQITEKSSLNESAVKLLSIPVNASKQWLFYMARGYLPWNALKADDTWFENVLQAFAVDFKGITQLRSVIQSNPAALERIVQQHPEKYLVRLVEIITAEKQTRLIKILNELFFLFNEVLFKGKKPVLKNDFLNLLWKKIFYAAASGKGKLMSQKITEDILRAQLPAIRKNKLFISKNKSKLKYIHPVLIQLLNEEDLLPVPTKNKEDSTPHKVTKGIAIKNEQLKKSNEAKAIEKRNTLDVETDNQLLKIDVSDLAEEKPVAEKSSYKSIDEEGIYIQHAGVVLLHPFLSRFFENIKLVRDQKFISDEKHQKALCILHYFATGNTQVQEYELVIAKVLCGYPLQEPVNTKIKISKKEKAQADDLLAAAIEHWEKIGSTSAATLREEFLQRNGKLFTKNDNLYLQMESGPIDMLLDYLPWNISMIRLPWMKEILRVEWR